jgi:hypothetical protein
MFLVSVMLGVQDTVRDKVPDMTASSEPYLLAAADL